MPLVQVHNIRLTPSPNIRMHGGPSFSTVVTRTDTGWRYANANWPYALWKITLQYIRKSKDFNDIVAFWLARRGPAYAFLIRDPLDHADWGNGHVRMVEGHYRLVKEYPDDINPYERLITRPLPGTVNLSQVPGTGGVPGAGVSVDPLTGIVTGATAPGPATFQFDVPVAFMKDAMEYDYSTGDLAEWMNVELEEVRV